MKLSNISTAPYRPQIKRLGQKDLPSSQYGYFNDRQSGISPELENSWTYQNKLRKDSQKKKKKLTRQACFWIIVALILLLIIGAIIGIVLGLTLPISKSTESSTTKAASISTINPTSSTSITTTSISIICSHTGHGTIAFQNGSTPSTWTPYSYSFTAIKTASTIVFGFETDGTNSFYMDTVSVVDTGAPLNQLLINPNFENSTIIPTGWMVSCEMTFCGGSGTRIETSSLCSSGYCFQSFCLVGRVGLIFLSQTFATISGNSHTISFMLTRSNTPSTGFMAFYLDIF